MKHLLVAITLILPMFAKAQGKPFTIKGKADKLDAPLKAYLSYRSGDNFLRDSVLLEKGVFNFKGKIEEPCLASLSIDEQSFNCYIEPGVIIAHSTDTLKSMIITGTPLNDDLNSLKLALKPLSSREQRNETMQQFIKAHPNSLVSFDALKQYAGFMPDPERVEPVYNYLSDELKAKKAVAAYYQLLQDIKRTSVGQTAPDFTQADTAGVDRSLHDFKGKYVLLDFWASWCKPCRKENPVVVSAFNQYKDKDFTIISISLDAPGAKEKWLKAIHDDGLSGWTHLSDLSFWGNPIAKLYAVQSIPQNFLLDKEGKIIAKNLRGRDLEGKLREILESTN